MAGLTHRLAEAIRSAGPDPEDQARAALVALREPSAEMLQAGQEAYIHQAALDEAKIWRAMVDAAAGVQAGSTGSVRPWVDGADMAGTRPANDVYAAELKAPSSPGGPTVRRSRTAAPAPTWPLILSAVVLTTAVIGLAVAIFLVGRTV